MAIQLRRGLKQDFDPSRLKVAEMAVPIDTEEVYIKVSEETTKGLATLNPIGKLEQMPSFQDVGAAPASHDHSATDITSGVLPISLGGTTASTASAALSNLGGVPTTRTINSKALSSNINLTASDVGAANSSHTHSVSDISAGTWAVSQGGTGATTASNALTNLGAVPTTRTVNNKALSSNIAINAADVGAVSKGNFTCHVWAAGTVVINGWGEPYVKLTDLPSSLCCAIVNNGHGDAVDVRVISAEIWNVTELWVYFDRPLSVPIRINYVIFQFG